VSNELTVVAAQDRMAVMPVMDIETAVARYNAMKQFVSGVMERDRDYGVIPGTGNKPVLLKPGAEKLTTFFGLSVRFRVVDKTEDWTGADHDGEPFFYYWFTCQLCKGEHVIAEADGSCNSREAKYRYRKGERTCPQCGAAAIIKGRAEYGGGWLCYGKKGGCGAKFRDGDKGIEDQETGRVPNPDIADQVNTIQKMAQKRALIAATLLGVNASDFFTQDLEDFVDAPYHVVEPEPARPAPHPNGPPPTTPTYVKNERGVPMMPTEETEQAAPTGWETWSDRAHAAFWAKANELGLSKNVVHAGFDVESMKEFTGTMDDAKVILLALDYAVNKTDIGVAGLNAAISDILGGRVTGVVMQEGATFADVKDAVDQWIEGEIAKGATIQRQEGLPL